MALTTTNPNSRPIVTTETSAATGVSIAIDYTTYYDRIATALETIATNSTTIKNAIDNSSPTIASFNGSISGTTLTIGGSPAVTGTISVGMKLVGGTVLADTIIISGSGTSWTVSKSQTVTASSLFGYGANGYLTTILSNISVQQTTIATESATIATQATTLAAQTTTLAAQTTTIATQQTTMATKLTALEARAADQGIHIVGPWEWLGMSSIVKLYDEKGVDYNALKARVEQIPKGA